MKKSKLIGVAALMLSMGVVACDKTEDDGPKGDPATCEHEYADKFESDDTNHWKVCTKCGEKSKETKHKFNKDCSDQTGAEAPTCGTDGKIRKACECGKTDLVKDPKTGNHNYVDLGESAEGYVAPNCGKTGVMPQECTVCHDKKTRTLDKVGEHVFRDSTATDDLQGHIAKPASCVDGGTKIEVCNVCGEARDADIPAVGHNFAPVADSTVSPANCVSYSYTQCGACGAKRLIWAPDQATDASKATLNAAGNAFGGHPIGYKLKGTQPGAGNYEYDETATGDYFEFNFKSPVDGTYALCAMLTPSQYAQGNEIPVWKANDPANKDYTPGMKSAEELCDYRYIVLVNDCEVAPKADFEDVVAGAKGWYVSPFEIALQNGHEYNIKIVQAGGYEATFESFGFEFEGARGSITDFAGAAVTWNSQACDPSKSTSLETIGYNENGLVGIKMDNAYNVGTKKNQSKATPPSTIEHITEGEHVVYTIRSDKAYTNGKLSMKLNRWGQYLPDAGIKAFTTMSDDWYPGYIYNPEATGAEDDPIFTLAPARYSLLVNGIEIPFELDAPGYEEPMITSNTEDVEVMLPQDIALAAGLNFIEVRCMGGYECVIKSFTLTLGCEHEYRDPTAEETDYATTAADCTNDGRAYQICTKCNQVKVTKTKALGHDLEDYAGDEEHVASTVTCTTDGYSYKKCKTCQTILTYKTDALGHDYQDYAGDAEHVNSAVNACKDGVQWKKCSRCDGLKSEVIAAEVAHTFGDPVATTNAAGKAINTCTCSVCSAKKVSMALADLAEGSDEAAFPSNGKWTVGKTYVWNVVAPAEGDYTVYFNIKLGTSGQGNAQKWTGWSIKAGEVNGTILIDGLTYAQAGVSDTANGADVAFARVHLAAGENAVSITCTTYNYRNVMSGDIVFIA